MLKVYTSVILLINRSKENVEKQFQFLALKGAKLARKCTYPFQLLIKLKYQQIKKFFASSNSDFAFIMLINVKMPTICILDIVSA